MSGGSVKVALFEKDPITRFINKRLFLAYSPNVDLVQCDSLESGLQTISKNEFDIVIVDWHISHDTETILEIPQLLRKTLSEQENHHHRTCEPAERIRQG